MLCDICKTNVAKIHLTEIEGGKTKKVDLCEACSKEKGVEGSTSFALADVLLGLGASQEMATAAGGPEVKCKVCGLTQADFKKTGRFGCAECYSTFAEGLDGLLKSMHKGIRHVGKVPRVMRDTREVSEALKGLQKRLEKAIDDEDFEQAAIVRDEIKQMREKLDSFAAS
jgi:protein arginine kinase activator